MLPNTHILSPASLRSVSTPGVVGNVVNVGGVGGEVRRRVIVGVVPGIDNVGDGCDAAAYAEYPWLCDLPDSTSAAGMHADMACCECGGGYIDGSGGLSSCQEGFLDLELWGCDAYAEEPSLCYTAADYTNVDGVHAGMACKLVLSLGPQRRRRILQGIHFHRCYRSRVVLVLCVHAVSRHDIWGNLGRLGWSYEEL